MLRDRPAGGVLAAHPNVLACLRKLHVHAPPAAAHLAEPTAAEPAAAAEPTSATAEPAAAEPTSAAASPAAAAESATEPAAPPPGAPAAPGCGPRAPQPPRLADPGVHFARGRLLRLGERDGVVDGAGRPPGRRGALLSHYVLLRPHDFGRFRQRRDM